MAVVVCVPDDTLSASVAPCPASPVARPDVVQGVVLSLSEYNAIMSLNSPIDMDEGRNLVLTLAGWVFASYLTALGVGTVLATIRKV
jgi:hypothetical protein